MSVREKLVALLNNSFAEQYEKRGLLTAPHTATDLIAHGVTAQEWISVEDRQPEKNGLYITFGCSAEPVRWLHNFDHDVGKFGSWWDYEPDGKKHPRYRFIEAENITHWMPLPEPPKGE